MKNIFILGVSSLMLAVPQGLLAQSDTTFVAVGNPIVKHKFIADPAAMVHDGKMYIYGGHDVWGIERSGFFNGREKWAKGFENQRV